MHTGALTAPVNAGEKPASAVNYLSAFNSTSTPSTGLYLTVSLTFGVIFRAEIQLMKTSLF